MLLPKLPVHFRTSVLWAFLLCAAILPVVHADEGSPAGDGSARVEQSSVAEQQFALKVRLLMVHRDWASHGGDSLPGELEAFLESARLPEDKRSNDSMLSVNLFLPKAGKAAVFEKAALEGLLQWLRERELVADERTIELQETRFDNRWIASIEPQVDRGVRREQVWHLQLDLIHSNDPAMAGRIKVQRTHNRKPPPESPRLRGAALDIRKEVSFFLPRDRAVVMSWYAHPDDAELAPKVEQRAIEPILVFEVATDDERERPAVEFSLPEKVMDLIVE